MELIRKKYSAAPDLMAHQREGVDFLISRRCGLIAFEQGLGKTLVAIESFRQLLKSGELDSAVVICPNSLKNNWVAEISKFAPDICVCVVDGSRLVRRQIIAKTIAQMLIVNYETARSEVVAIRAFLKRRRSALILDESHNVKNARSLNSIAAQHLTEHANYRWLLSGTPVTNSASDIYPQLCVVSGKQPFGSFSAFEARYGAHASPEDRAILSEKIKPYILRRTKEECLDLPEKTFLDVRVELPDWQKKMYIAMRDDLAREVEGMTEAEFRQFVPTALTRLLRLSQIASNPALLLPDEKRVAGKTVELDRIVEDLVKNSNKKIIIWSYYVETLESLYSRYSEYGAALLYGKTDANDRQQVAKRFQEDPSLMILLANPAAAGTGFTLTAASYTIYETLTWRYDYYAQSQDRNHRIGQRNPVTYIRLIADNTIEQAIAEALERKNVLAREIVGDKITSSDIPNLSPEAFREILMNGTLPVGRSNEYKH